MTVETGAQTVRGKKVDEREKHGCNVKPDPEHESKGRRQLEHYHRWLGAGEEYRSIQRSVHDVLLELLRLCYHVHAIARQ